MKKLLKGLSVLEVILGVLCAVVAVAGLAMGGLLQGGAELPIEREALSLVKVSAGFGLASALFNLAGGVCGLQGANGNAGRLSTAIKLGWVSVVFGVVTGAVSLVGNVGVDQVLSAVACVIVPILFLVAALGVRSGK